MKKLLLPLVCVLLLCGCEKYELPTPEVETPEVVKVSYLSENLECQSLMAQFMAQRPDGEDGISRSNYSIFYSPQTESCIGAFSQNYKNIFCYRIFDLLNSAVEYTYCYNQDQEFSYSYINGEMEEIVGYFDGGNIHYLRSSKIEELKEKASQ